MSIELSCAVRADAVEAWRYLASPGAFRRLSPPFMPLRPVSEADSLRDGRAVLAPRSALPGPLGTTLGPPWVARHEPDGFVEGERFRDRCVSQPYAALTGWVHEHTVVDGPGGAVLGDRVRARVPARMLEPVFAYRYRHMDADLARLRELAGHGGDVPLTVAVTGASGLIGTALTALLGVAGHRVVRLVRGTADGVDERRWDPDAPSPDLLDSVDVLVHLAGAPVVGRFTDEHVARVRDSRVDPTRRLAELVAARGGRTTLVCASAIGYYGPDRGDEPLDEQADAGGGVLAGIVTDWENACAPARDTGARVVSMRTGLVLSGAGGLLPPLAAVVRSGLGGRIGSGRQWMSWISLDDLADLYLRAVVDPDVAGPINAVAPGPVRNDEFVEALGSVLRRPTPLPVPGWAPGVALRRDGARETVLADQRVEPGWAVSTGHRFRHLDLSSAFAVELGRQSVPGPTELLGAGA
ncbi:TIGR01777 family oxidoreductase [Dietzia sp. 179-F 9C3 NHS]|uniref:TIGR01777 family oxidoreductase n=1 Tax=Dietzia sp. 179-F 9C3 NHS TaxID=3374295 RepID=UPI003878F5CF